jgi:transcriptional regulator with XRE-family HTH domain
LLLLALRPVVQGGQDAEPKTLGAALRGLRETAGKSLTQTARAGGHGYAEALNESYLSKIERGERRPSLPMLLAILEGLGVDERELPTVVRMNLFRLMIDEEQVGAERALEMFSRLPQRRAGAGLPVLPGELRHRIEEARRVRADQAEAGSPSGEGSRSGSDRS